MYPTRLSVVLASSALFVVAACGDGRVEVPGAGGEGSVGGDCRDGADNDEDGLFDCDDDGCAASPDCEGSDENAAPSGAAIAIEPATPGDGDDLSCTIVTEATDPNGDALTYRFGWARNGADAGVDSATVGAALTSGGDTWTCTVTPNDGALDGAPASVSVTITQGNEAPSAPGVSITPAAPTDDDVLTCVIDTESVDPDGDAVTYSYAWSVDGVDAGVSAASVNSTRTTAGETWTCSVTANDGELSGEAGTASVEVLRRCDADGDGFDGAACGGDDCDDTDARIYPRAGDTYGDGVDGDCDGMDCEAAFTGAAYFAFCRSVSSAVVAWADADAACVTAGYDALASIHDDAEAEAVFALVTESGLASSEAPWIGLSDVAREGSWVWSDGTPYDYADWMSGEPNGGVSENCVQINPWDYQVSREWNDYSCAPSGGEYGRSFVCGSR